MKNPGVRGQAGTYRGAVGRTDRGMQGLAGDFPVDLSGIWLVYAVWFWVFVGRVFGFAVFSAFWHATTGRWGREQYFWRCASWLVVSKSERESVVGGESHGTTTKPEKNSNRLLP